MILDLSIFSVYGLGAGFKQGHRPGTRVGIVHNEIYYKMAARKPVSKAWIKENRKFFCFDKTLLLNILGGCKKQGTL
mgnify:CR=1 FL=1